MTIAEKIVEYLYEYGDTREADVITYIKGLGYHIKSVKNAIAKLQKDARINRIVHAKLQPPAVYLSLEEKRLPIEIQKELIRANAQMTVAELQAYGMMGSKER